MGKAPCPLTDELIKRYINIVAQPTIITQMDKTRAMQAEEMRTLGLQRPDPHNNSAMNNFNEHRKRTAQLHAGELGSLVHREIIHWVLDEMVRLENAEQRKHLPREGEIGHIAKRLRNDLRRDADWALQNNGSAESLVESYAQRVNAMEKLLEEHAEWLTWRLLQDDISETEDYLQHIRAQMKHTRDPTTQKRLKLEEQEKMITLQQDRTALQKHRAQEREWKEELSELRTIWPRAIQQEKALKDRLAAHAEKQMRQPDTPNSKDSSDHEHSISSNSVVFLTPD